MKFRYIFNISNLVNLLLRAFVIWGIAMNGYSALYIEFCLYVQKLENFMKLYYYFLSLSEMVFKIISSSPGCCKNLFVFLCNLLKSLKNGKKHFLNFIFSDEDRHHCLLKQKYPHQYAQHKKIRAGSVCFFLAESD